MITIYYLVTKPITIIMRIEVQVIANSVLQRVPAVVLKIKSNQYIFNTPELFNRYSSKHHFSYGSRRINIFYTQHNSDAMGGLITTVSSLLYSNKTYGTKIFAGSHATKYFQ